MSIWTGEQQGDQLLLRLFNNAVLTAGVTSFLVEPNTGWLFVGLHSGQIKAFQQKPETELVIKGHENEVTQMCRTIFRHEDALLAGALVHAPADLLLFDSTEVRNKLFFTTTTRTPLLKRTISCKYCF